MYQYMKIYHSLFSYLDASFLQTIFLGTKVSGLTRLQSKYIFSYYCNDQIDYAIKDARWLYLSSYPHILGTIKTDSTVYTSRVIRFTSAFSQVTSHNAIPFTVISLLTTTIAQSADRLHLFNVGKWCPVVYTAKGNVHCNNDIVIEDISIPFTLPHDPWASTFTWVFIIANQLQNFII
jgi:hypothetical protein